MSNTVPDWAARLQAQVAVHTAEIARLQARQERSENFLLGVLVALAVLYLRGQGVEVPT